MDILESTLESALTKKAILDDLRPIDPEREQRILQKFRLDWNYHSNHIEGNSLSYGETKALILFNITAQGKPLKDHFEITGHNEAIDWVLDVIKGERGLTETFIRELHELILKEPRMSKAITADGQPTQKRIEIGRYKSSPNHVKTVTGEIFYFATPEETPAKMHDLLHWYHEQKNAAETNPIIFASEFHYKFIRIHPFDDGNGRLARILMNFILLQYGYPPVIVKTEDKGNYYRALQLADADDFKAFTEYIASNLIRSLDIMIAGARGESIEEPDDLDKELLLLDQQINAIGEKSVYRSTELVRDLVNTSFTKVLAKCNERFKKLFPYYNESGFAIEIDNRYNKKIDSNLSLEEIIKSTMHIDNEIEYLSFNKLIFIYTFSSFLPRPNNKNIIKIDRFQNTITINLFDIYYKISNIDGDIVDKHYDDELTDQEIDSIVKKEEIRHKKFILEKIKEAEKEAK